jgi:penicillin-binding protein 1A
VTNDNHRSSDNSAVQDSEKPSGGGFFKKLFMLMAFGTLAGMVLGGALYWKFARDLPDIITPEDYRPDLVTQFIAVGPNPKSNEQGKVIAEFAKERRYLLPYEKIPQNVVHAFISAEDEKFFQHPGIDILGIIRAALADLKAGHRVQGGSTITQQVTKSLILSSEKTFSRKIKEIILARKLEQHLTKQQILYLYLNEIYLGHGAYGIEAASRQYFRKPASQMTLAEAAILAGMPQAPGKYSPLLNPKRAKERQTYVLHRMRESGYITDAQMNEAIAEPVRVYEAEDINDKYAPYLVEYIRKYIAEKYGDKALYEDGLTVTLPTSAELLMASRKSVQEGLESVDKRSGYRGPIQKLHDNEVSAYLEDLRAKLIQKKLESQVLTPDGRLDPTGALKLAGISTDEELLDVGETYQAVVTEVNDAKKLAEVHIGRIRAIMPFEKMKWARMALDPKNSATVGREPRFPSMVVKKNDVVLVKVASISNGIVTVGLEQEPLVQGALLSIEARSGYVLAMEGGYDFGKSEYNRAVQSARQPGSSFKPILYAAALERGFTPASIIVDSPIVYSDGDLGKWKPGNFEEKFYGDTTFRQALIHSRNVPTIKILQQVQIPYLINYAKRLGITSPLPSDLSISLGSAGISLLELTKVYSLFPRLGRKVEPIFFTKIADRDGKTLEEHLPEPLPATPKIAALDQPAPSASEAPTTGPSSGPAVQPVTQTNSQQGQPFVLPSYPPADDPDQLLDPRVAYVMTHLMKEVVAFGTGQDAQQLGRPAAGKTGTTSEYSDAWFMGFTPYVVTGAWVGYDNHRPIGHLETGARAALPIWLSFMRAATASYPPDDFQVPPGIVFASIDQHSGKVVSPDSLKAIKEAFIEGTEPKARSSGGRNSTEESGSSDFFKEDLE